MGQTDPAAFERRRHPRWKVPRDGKHVVELWWPSRRGHLLILPLKDLSRGGLSFVVDCELPGLEVCRPIRTVLVRLGGLEIKADLVVIHITTGPGATTVCGTLIFPKTDNDIVALNAWLGTHEPE